MRQRENARARVLVNVYMREQRRDIDINRGQGRAGACFVIRAPLTSEVVNLRERYSDRASFEAISNFSRGSGSTLFAHLSSQEDATRWRHPPPRPHGVRTCPVTYETSIYAKYDPIYDGYARCESIDDTCVCIRPSAIFLSP